MVVAAVRTELHFCMKKGTKQQHWRLSSLEKKWYYYTLDWLWPTGQWRASSLGTNRKPHAVTNLLNWKPLPFQNTVCSPFTSWIPELNWADLLNIHLGSWQVISLVIMVQQLYGKVNSKIDDGQSSNSEIESPAASNVCWSKKSVLNVNSDS